MGRISKSTVFIERKARSTRERSLYAWTAWAVLSSAAGTLVRDDIDAVELGLSRDLIDLAREGEVTVADVKNEVLGHFLRIDDLANGKADLAGSVEPRAFAMDLSLNARKLPLGRDQKRLALSGAFTGKFAIATHDQSFARKVRRADLRQIPLVKQRYSSVLRGHYGYFGMPHNWRSLNAFRHEIRRIWFTCLRRRSQKNRRVGWDMYYGCHVAKLMNTTIIAHGYS
jgi:hypothetical protein